MEGNAGAEQKRSILQLTRLERFTDVIYAVILVQIFLLIPRPGEEEWQWGTIGQFVVDNALTFVLVLVSTLVVIIYWLQSNALLGRLERTDGRHTALSILQMLFLMLFLKAMRLGIELGGSTGTRAFESATAALVGIAGGLAFSYGIKNRRLLRSGVSDDDARAFAQRTMAEPITALITLPLSAFPILWELSWLTYPLVVRLLKRRA